MSESLLVAGAFALSGLGLLLAGAAHWTGRMRSGKPVVAGSYTGRLYLAVPGSLALIVFGLVILLNAQGVAEAATEWLFIGVLVLFAVNAVLILWHPERLRPAWQRRSLERAQGRAELRAAAARAGHELIVLLAVEGEEQAVSSAGDLATARDAGRAALDGHPHARFATVLDTGACEVVETIARA